MIKKWNKDCDKEMAFSSFHHFNFLRNQIIEGFLDNSFKCLFSRITQILLISAHISVSKEKSSTQRVCFCNIYLPISKMSKWPLALHLKNFRTTRLIERALSKTYVSWIFRKKTLKILKNGKSGKFAHVFESNDIIV